jgi:hypothetical protein
MHGGEREGAVSLHNKVKWERIARKLLEYTKNIIRRREGERERELSPCIIRSSGSAELARKY